MGLATLTEVVETTDAEGNISEFELIVDFNATPSQGVSRTSNATNHPVERNNAAKSSITDHISVNPNQIDLDIMLSNFDDPAVENFQNEDEIPDTVSAKMEVMERWQKDGTLLRYDGHNRIDDDVLIINLGDTFATASGEALVIKLSLLKIRIAEAATAQLRVPKPIRKIEKKGKQDPKAKVVSAETEAESEETKSDWTDKLFAAFR